MPALIGAVMGVATALLVAACSGDDATGTGGSAGQGGSAGSAGGTAGTGGVGAGGGAGGAGGATSSGGGGGGGSEPEPPKPGNLVDYVTGNDADADVTPTGPGLIVMGGGLDVDAAFE